MQRSPILEHSDSDADRSCFIDHLKVSQPRKGDRPWSPHDVASQPRITFFEG